MVGESNLADVDGRVGQRRHGQLPRQKTAFWLERLIADAFPRWQAEVNHRVS